MWSKTIGKTTEKPSLSPVARHVCLALCDYMKLRDIEYVSLLVCRAVSADGGARLITISVEDPMTVLEGRSMSPRQAEPRWIDSYEVV